MAACLAISARTSELRAFRLVSRPSWLRCTFTLSYRFCWPFLARSVTSVRSAASRCCRWLWRHNGKMIWISLRHMVSLAMTWRTCECLCTLRFKRPIWAKQINFRTTMSALVKTILTFTIRRCWFRKVVNKTHLGRFSQTLQIMGFQRPPSLNWWVDPRFQPTINSITHHITCCNSSAVTSSSELMELRCHASTPDGRLYLCGEKKKFLRYFKFESYQQILGNHTWKRWAGKRVRSWDPLGDLSFGKVEANSPTVEHVRGAFYPVVRSLFLQESMTFTDDGVPIWNDGSWNLWPLRLQQILRLPFCQQKSWWFS